jgi:hypothetical protein
MVRMAQMEVRKCSSTYASMQNEKMHNCCPWQHNYWMALSNQLTFLYPQLLQV